MTQQQEPKRKQGSQTTRQTTRQTTEEPTQKLTIAIPALPPPEASPNWRGHWSARHKAISIYRTMACLYTKNTTGYRQWKPLSKATLKATMVVKNRTYIKDADNAIATLKAAIDGIVEAGILTDDKDIAIMPVQYKTDKQRAPQTIIEIEPMTPTRRRRTPTQQHHPTRHNTERERA